MMDWTKAANELAKPLSAAAVKERAQAGRKLSYIEGWHAIAEANRIFGFDAWTRETVEIKCVAEREREIGQAKKPGWSVSYIARVRVTVAGVIREGVGAGHGIDADLGQAHESAIKEAETDAMKRALMTFGNPFGLALYDKTQANVSDAPGSGNERDAGEAADHLIDLLKKCATESELAELKESAGFSGVLNSLPEMHFKLVAAVYKTKKAELAPKAA
jgi:DNA recombination protein Rad52